ncbi:hypothetical protein HZS_2598 [Henneguya salminicola]|nr:hypothetical protein HZS_2598 [Henneguya salminicola]
MPLNEINERLKRIGKNVVKYLRKEKFFATKKPVQSAFDVNKSLDKVDNNMSRNNRHCEYDSKTDKKQEISNKYSKLELDLVLEISKKYPENIELKDLMTNFLLKSNRHNLNNLDVETHFFKSVKILEEQLQKSFSFTLNQESREAEHYKALYNKNKVKLEESESIKTILKNVINIQKNLDTFEFFKKQVLYRKKIRINSVQFPASQFPANFTQSGHTAASDDNQYIVYKKINHHVINEDLNKDTKFCDLNQTVIDHIRRLLQERCIDIQLFDSFEIENSESQGLISFLQLLINDYCKIKHTRGTKIKGSHTDLFCMKDLLCDIFETFSNKILKVLRDLNDPITYTVISDDFLLCLDTFSQRIKDSTLKNNVKEPILTKISNIKQESKEININCVISQKGLTKDEFNHQLYTSLNDSIDKILQGIFLTQQSPSKSDTTQIDIPIKYDHVIELPLPSIQSSFIDTINILNSFLSTLMRHAHNRYTKSIRIWADQASTYTQEIIDAEKRSEDEKNAFSEQDFTIFIEHKFIDLLNVKIKNESLIKKIQENEKKVDELQKILSSNPFVYSISKKMAELLPSLNRRHYEYEIESLIYSIISSFSMLLDKNLRSSFDLSREAAETLELSFNSFVESVDNCATSLSEKLLELKTVIDSYESINDQHLIEVNRLNTSLDRSNLRVIQLEDELESRIVTDSLNTQVLDTTEKIADLCDSVLKYSSNLIEEGQQLMSRHNSEENPDQNMDDLKKNTFCSLNENIELINENLENFLDGIETTSEEEIALDTPPKSHLSLSEMEKNNMGTELSQDENRKIEVISIEASSKLQRLEEAIESLHRINLELIHSQHLIEQCDRNTNSKINAFIRSLNLYSIRRTNINETESSLQSIAITQNSDTSSTNVDSNENSAQLSFTPMGPVLHI